jgi:serine/threonine-protein kinase HipA
MTQIAVYADWESLNGARRLGFLHVRKARANEVFEFEYDPAALADPELNFMKLDPRINFSKDTSSPAGTKPSSACCRLKPRSLGTLIDETASGADIRDGCCQAAASFTNPTACWVYMTSFALEACAQA